MEKEFKDWVDKKLERQARRHPVMHTIKQKADEYFIKTSQFYSGTKPLSAFDSEDYSIIDKYRFKLGKIVDENYIKFKNLTKAPLSFISNIYRNFKNIIDSKFEKCIPDDQNIVISNKTSENKSKIIKSNFVKLKIFIQYGKVDMNDPLIQKLITNDLTNQKVDFKMKANRVANFFGNVFSIRPNYIISLNNEIKQRQSITIKNYQTIFYKLFKISTSNINITRRQVIIYLLGLYILSNIGKTYKIRYESFANENQIKEKFDRIDHFLAGNNANKKLTIFDDKTDQKFYDILKNERNLFALKDIDDYKDENSSTNKFFINYAYNEYNTDLLISSLSFLYFIFLLRKKYKKLITWGKLLKHSFIFTLVLNEVFNTVFNSVQYNHMLSYYLTDLSKINDNKSFHKYLFYRENIDKLLI